MSTMNPEIKGKWIEALRSGRYVQYRGALHSFNRNEHCCLGVLWDVCGQPDSIDDLWMQHVGETKERLVAMNDDEEKSFAEIADYIEKNL